jgi:hypothetical protein
MRRTVWGTFCSLTSEAFGSWAFAATIFVADEGLPFLDVEDDADAEDETERRAMIHL